MRKVLIPIILACLVSPLTEAADEDLVTHATQAYYAGRLDEAAQVFNQLKAKQRGNGHIEYNLGNIAYKKGRLGQAIAHYERAQRLMPRDTDLRANLNFVQGKKIDAFHFDDLKTTVGKNFFFWNSFMSLSEGFHWLAVLFAAAWILGWIYLLARKSILKVSTIILAAVTLTFGASVAFKYNMEKVQRHGVIISAEVNVQESFLSPKPILKLHEGTGVRILSEQKLGNNELWLQVKLMDDKKGWVKGGDVEII